MNEEAEKRRIARIARERAAGVYEETQQAKFLELVAAQRSGLSVGRAMRNPYMADADPAKLAKTGRNDPCPCGRGRKAKHCCMESAQQIRAQAFGASTEA